MGRVTMRGQNLLVRGSVDVEKDLTVGGNFVFGDAAVDVLDVNGYLTFTGTAVANCLKFTGTTGTATDGSLISTGTTWINHATAGQCAVKILASNSATTGDYATLRIRGRSDAAGATVSGNFAASANVNDHGDLYALQGYAQPLAKTQAGANNIVCGVYSCIDATAASVGRRWSAWVDDHSTTKASGGHYLMRLSNNSTNSTQFDGIFTIYSGAGCDYLFNIEGTNAPYSAATGSATITGKLAVKVGTDVVYIPLASGIA